MQTRSVLAASLLAAFIAGTGAVNAADSRDTTKDSTMTPPSQRATPDRDHQSGGMHGGGMMGGTGNTMGGGMMGHSTMDGMGEMMGMMNGCSQMMGSSAVPHLPPGNEKLQLKMQAEIMQKTAEILSRYADQIGQTK